MNPEDQNLYTTPVTAVEATVAAEPTTLPTFVDVKIKRKQSRELRALLFKGVQFVDGSVSNLDVFLSNQELAKNELMKLYYSSITDVDGLENQEFDQLYAPIEQLDPLGLAAKVISNT